MKTKILKRLKENDNFISGEKLSQEFHMTRSGIWKYINMLKEEGYIIESIPRRGYRLTSSPDILTFEEIRKYLNTEFMGRNLYYFDSVDSTNNQAKKIASKEMEGTCLIAEQQVEGKGRLGRRWISPKKKGIWMSVILKPDMEPYNVGSITLLGAASVYKALKKMDIDSQIKWPNDILINNKKIGGILTEISAELNKINYLVMGIGINVNLDEKDIPDELKTKATSIKINENRRIDRKILLANILNEFESLYISFVNENSNSKAIEICRKNSATIGKEVKVRQGKEEKLGKALDINNKGELVVEFKEGHIQNIFAGEVSVRGLEGYI
ncbi:MAG: biotin--[acetyl-CoA-carboxylase] ligase [Tissierella sp.]|uniref:biotin--[acetyl-CoA-carboxylase] ligase n=1 Tax=Tissierella sp. TaxID=41274 RepID=UPI003F965D79